MDFTESTKILYSRIKKLEPNDASKILGFLFLQDNSNRDMIHLAYSTDNVILSMISKVKTELGLMSPNLPIFLQNAPPLALQLEPTNPYWNSPLPPPDHNIEFQHQPNVESIPQDSLLLQNHLQLLSLDENCYARSPSQGTTGLARVCHYFAKGFCKHGNTCRFLHENLNEGLNEDQLFSPRSLEMLEVEVTQLLRSRNGAPVSIAMLPMLYYETYGKILQADGYLTESQRHGRAGLSLTKLLDRMRTNIRVIESRAHGQHSVVLAEDFPQYLDYGNEQIQYGGFPIAACQIYLTFPADSAFTEEEVCTHFKGYGPVLDVRLPFQQRRMFGFVTFVYPESVRGVLAKGNPHFIGGSRILVKPYREKPRTAEKRAAERKQPIYFGSQFVDGDSNPPQPVSRTSFDTRYVRQNFVEEYEGELELQRRRLSEFQLLPKQVSTLHGNDYSTAELKLKEVAAYGEQPDFQDPESFSFLFDSLSMMDGSTSEERTRCISSTCNDHNSYQGIIFPDSPFSYPVA